MSVLDWLLGESRIGWLKTALLALFFGMAIMFMIDPSWVDKPPSSGRFAMISLGYIPLAIVRALYWRRRGDALLERVVRLGEAARPEVQSIQRWNGTLWCELEQVLDQRATRGLSGL